MAMKAAQIHLQQPTTEIVFTYSTKNLHDFVKKLITQFYRQFADVDPDWNKIHIMHAWGGQNLEGLYHKTCVDNNINFISWGDVKGYGKNAFNEACKPLVSKNLRTSYDYVIIDEGQDFPTNFYRLCRKITKNNNIIWAYDECQNILDTELQNTVETFGPDNFGNPYIDFSNNSVEDQDLVLHKCYRNPRQILVSAFALGMGIYSDIVQLPESKELWEDWGFEIVLGDYSTNDQMRIVRPDKNSPLLKNRLITAEDVIKFSFFDSVEDECSYIVESILDDLAQELRPEDIMVISLDDVNTKKYFTIISTKLAEKSISCFNLLNAPNINTKFCMENNVTLTTVYRAKGNEAPQVYIIGIDHVFKNRCFPEKRNKIFTAMTRAQGWVSITGVGQQAEEFCNEMRKVIDNNFELKFTMPDLHKLKLFQRDLEIEQATLNKINRIINEAAIELGISKDVVQASVFKKFGEGGNNK